MTGKALFFVKIQRTKSTCGKITPLWQKKRFFLSRQRSKEHRGFTKTPSTGKAPYHCDGWSFVFLEIQRTKNTCGKITPLWQEKRFFPSRQRSKEHRGFTKTPSTGKALLSESQFVILFQSFYKFFMPCRLFFSHFVTIYYYTMINTAWRVLVKDVILDCYFFSRLCLTHHFAVHFLLRCAMVVKNS